MKKEYKKVTINAIYRLKHQSLISAFRTGSGRYQRLAVQTFDSSLSYRFQSFDIKKWLGWKDSNFRNDGVRVRCLTAWRHPKIAIACIRHSRSGWDRWIRTIGMTESKSVALPLGYIPVSILNVTRLLYQYFAPNASAAALCLQKIHNYLSAAIKNFGKVSKSVDFQ